MQHHLSILFSWSAGGPLRNLCSPSRWTNWTVVTRLRRLGYCNAVIMFTEQRHPVVWVSLYKPEVFHLEMLLHHSNSWPQSKAAIIILMNLPDPVISWLVKHKTKGWLVGSLPYIMTVVTGHYKFIWLVVFSSLPCLFTGSGCQTSVCAYVWESVCVCVPACRWMEVLWISGWHETHDKSKYQNGNCIMILFF